MSSMTTKNLPSYILQYSSLRIAVLAFPMWSGPDGNGANLITTFPFSAFGSSFSPSLISRLEVFVSSFSYSSFCVSIESLFVSLIAFWILGIMFLIWDFSNPSANRLESIACWFAVPLCFIAFSNV